MDTTDPDTPTDLASECAFEVESAADIDGTDPSLTSCLYVEWSFDVDAAFPTSDYVSEGGLSAQDFVNGGKTIGAAVGGRGRPGTNENPVSAMWPLPTGTPEGTVFFSTGSNDTATYWTEHTEVPTDQFDDWYPTNN